MDTKTNKECIIQTDDILGPNEQYGVYSLKCAKRTNYTLYYKDRCGKEVAVTRTCVKKRTETCWDDLIYVGVVTGFVRYDYFHGSTINNSSSVPKETRSKEFIIETDELLGPGEKYGVYSLKCAKNRGHTLYYNDRCENQVAITGTYTKKKTGTYWDDVKYVGIVTDIVRYDRFHAIRINSRFNPDPVLKKLGSCGVPRSRCYCLNSACDMCKQGTDK